MTQFMVRSLISILAFLALFCVVAFVYFAIFGQAESPQTWTAIVTGCFLLVFIGKIFWWLRTPRDPS
jgi:uncharacterized membrane protein